MWQSLPVIIPVSKPSVSIHPQLLLIPEPTQLLCIAFMSSFTASRAALRLHPHKSPVLESSKSRPPHGIHVSVAYDSSLFSSLVSSCSSLNLVRESRTTHYPGTPHAWVRQIAHCSQPCDSKTHYHWVQTSAATRGMATSTLVQHVLITLMH